MRCCAARWSAATRRRRMSMRPTKRLMTRSTWRRQPPVMGTSRSRKAGGIWTGRRQDRSRPLDVLYISQQADREFQHGRLAEPLTSCQQGKEAAGFSAETNVQLLFRGHENQYSTVLTVRNHWGATTAWVVTGNRSR